MWFFVLRAKWRAGRGPAVRLGLAMPQAVRAVPCGDPSST
jgi:hypothetical protein